MRRMPKFVSDVNVSNKASVAMSEGTKFVNETIDPNLRANDLLGCLKIAMQDNRPSWFIRRVHGVYNRRRLTEERKVLGLN